MKKIALILLLMIPLKVGAISAASAIVMDLDNDRIYYERNSNTPRLIASTTKIMTCLVAIENADLTKQVTVGEEILKSFGSDIYIEIGEKLTLKDLLYGLMLRSGNDAAMVIDKNVAGDMAGFAKLMNAKAQEIGMTNTYFYNAHGLEENSGEGNTSTAYDMALLTKYAYQNKTFREIFGTKNKTIKSSTKTYSWKSKNKLIHRYDYITGGKTGFTEKARRTLVTTGAKDNINLVIVTLNDPNDFQDHIALYEDVFASYQALKVLDQKNFKVKKDKYYADDTLYIKNNVYLPLKNAEQKDLKINYALTKLKNYEDGDVVGQAEIYLKEKVVRKTNIYVHTSKKKTTKLSFWQKIWRWFKTW